METYKLELIEFLTQIDEQICNFLLIQEERFNDVRSFLSRFYHNKSQWVNIFKNTVGFENKFNKELDRTIREIYENVNELLIAKQILLDDKCIKVKYEPRIKKIDKTIDFYIEYSNDKSIYCDVKTIHSIRKDKLGQLKDWNNYNKHIKENNIEGLTLFKEGLGGLFWHNYVSSRTKMLNYIRELEFKVNYVNNSDEVKFVMLYCGNGFDYHVDLLEDFADFYNRGKHRSDDFFSKMEKHTLETDDITLLRNVDEFWYLERNICDIEPRKFIKNVKGPEQKIFFMT